jgi:DeoR family transcriptional regulator of aga operon
VPQGQSELAFDVRLRLHAGPKRAIARAAAQMVGDGEAVALDSSTTAYYLALELRDKRELVVVTNGLLIAAALADAPGVSVLVTGGMLRLPAMSVVGDLAAEFVRTTRIDIGFFGARGLSVDGGLMDLSPDEVRVKSALAAACRRVVGIFDSSKWERTALLSFVGADRVDTLVTDADAPLSLIDAWRARGVDVIVADRAAAGSAPEVLPELRRTPAAPRAARSRSQRTA